jgi:uncharacterized protein involved in response to NO
LTNKSRINTIIITIIITTIIITNIINIINTRIRTFVASRRTTGVHSRAAAAAAVVVVVAVVMASLGAASATVASAVALVAGVAVTNRSLYHRCDGGRRCRCLMTGIAGTETRTKRCRRHR